jgi:hypothetical protein
MADSDTRPGHPCHAEYGRLQVPWALAPRGPDPRGPTRTGRTMHGPLQFTHPTHSVDLLGLARQERELLTSRRLVSPHMSPLPADRASSLSTFVTCTNQALQQSIHSFARSHAQQVLTLNFLTSHTRCVEAIMAKERKKGLPIRHMQIPGALTRVLEGGLCWPGCYLSLDVVFRSNF